MTQFEHIGVQNQMDATNIFEANRAFSSSCRFCSERGIRIECDRCAISVVHDRIVAVMKGKGFQDTDPAILVDQRRFAP